MSKRISIGILLISFLTIQMYGQVYEGKWSEEKANKWYSSYDWFAGTNFSPSTAINQLEMWQAETFDLETIDRELKWSADLGFNLHRVYLHNLLWQQNSCAFIDRMDQFLEVADKYNIKIMFVLFDDVWDPNPKLGKQREPVPHRHNSGWLQAPGKEYLQNEGMHPLLEAYVKGVLSAFKNDNRVAVWDLYNEPTQENTGWYGEESVNKTELAPDIKRKYTLRLVKKTFKWAREVNPSQPITMGIWWNDINNWGTPEKLLDVDRVMIENSDIITFHTYDKDINIVNKKISELKKYGRPIICTEYMARSENNTFENLMPLFKEENIGAISWGFVSGKTNTIYPWHSWQETFTAEPEIWHHDILRQDGTPYDQGEIDLIKTLTNK
ncbi:cellulase family glycosylhydrolase [uncultured Algibacter sp.]|uniref:cellulase family glycosylhydrolase n=1 Tax=uncultured Algibacter sp. TaxID=298659 RepID=UPI002619935B|nr:cellulase family glycosylhydrolase [uncultured Algibacter sp.]